MTQIVRSQILTTDAFWRRTSWRCRRRRRRRRLYLNDENISLLVEQTRQMPTAPSRTSKIRTNSFEQLEPNPLPLFAVQVCLVDWKMSLVAAR